MANTLQHFFPHLAESFPDLNQSNETTEAQRQIFGIKLPNETSRSLLIGEFGSGKTALLFQFALSYATEGRKVVFITHSKLESMPVQIEGTTRPDAMLMKQVQLLYLSDRDAMIEYLSTLHTQSNLPSVIIVDDLDFYCKITQGGDLNTCLGFTCALLLDTAAFITQKQCSNDEYQECVVLASIRANMDEKDSLLDYACYTNFFTTVYRIKRTDNQQSLYQVVCESTKKSLDVTVTYEITSSNIRVLDVSSDSLDDVTESQF